MLTRREILERLAHADSISTALLVEAVELLIKCYIVGHRQGWQDGATNAEVFDEVNDFLSEQLGDNWSNPHADGSP